MKPVTTWVVVSGRLRVYRGRDLVAEFDADQFPEMIVGMARALSDRRVSLDDPSLPLG